MEPAHLLLSGMAFFPIGRGLVAPRDFTISDKPVMVLGQDFGTVEYVRRLDEEGRTEEVNSQTWRELRQLLPASGIPLEDCFFTNVYMGLRKAGNMVGVLPASKNVVYRAWCEGFFRLQLSIQRPRMIVVLGMEPARFVGRIFPEVGVWNARATFTQLQTNGQLARTISAEHGDVAVVVIPHPSFLHANQHRCKWHGISGRPALERMLTDVFSDARSGNSE